MRGITLSSPTFRFIDDMARQLPRFSFAGGRRCAASQLLYHLGLRGIEWDLLPFCRRHRIAVMAYSPVGQGKLLKQRALQLVARRLGITPAQLALAWLLRQQGVAA